MANLNAGVTAQLNMMSAEVFDGRPTLGMTNSFNILNAGNNLQNVASGLSYTPAP